MNFETQKTLDNIKLYAGVFYFFGYVQFYYLFIEMYIHIGFPVDEEYGVLFSCFFPMMILSVVLVYFLKLKKTAMSNIKSSVSLFTFGLYHTTFNFLNTLTDVKASMVIGLAMTLIIVNFSTKSILKEDAKLSEILNRNSEVENL